MDTIVVGVDGSTGAIHALRWAAHTARRTHATVHVVHAAPETPPYPALTADTEFFPFNERREVERGAAQQVLDAAVTATAGALDGLDVQTRIEHGDPAMVLAGLAHSADLVVLGATGVHGHRGTVADVFDAVDRSAHGKVVVVPHDDADVFVGYPAHRVVALAPTAHQAHGIHTALTERGIPARHIEILSSEEGAHAIDAEGREHGPLTRLLRWVQHYGVEHDTAQDHQAGLLAGEFLVRVLVSDDDEKKIVRRVLVEHGAHDAHFFGRWTVERMLE